MVVLCSKCVFIIVDKLYSMEVQFTAGHATVAYTVV